MAGKIYSIEMNEKLAKKDVLLVLLDISIDDNALMSSIQIMKSLFLVKNELNLRDFYEFEPYLYGPCSFEVYTNLIILSDEKLIDEVKTPFSWNYYKTTPKGSEIAKHISSKIDKNLVKKMQEIKKLVLGMNFIELLEYVYKKYPESAINSIFRLEGLEKI